ncbi:MAG: CvpA family protein [Burkholderiaceae bacterium]|nr:CvpA family protein [Burkholderiaceae bacterium]
MSIEQLTGWDYFVLATLAISVALGALRGLVRTVFALAAWVVALLGAPLATPPLLAFTGWSFPPLFVGVFVFFVLLVAVRLFGALLARLLARVGLGLVDRTLGSALGVLRALVVVAIVALVGRQLGADREAAWQQALSRPLLDVLVSWVDPWLPTRAAPLQPVRTTRRGPSCAESWAS